MYKIDILNLSYQGYYSTAGSSWTTEIFNAISEPIIESMCDIFDMVVFDDMTKSTSRGNAYYIGYDDESEPRFYIGWNTGYSGTTEYALYMITLYDGELLSSYITNSSHSDSDKYARMLFYARPNNSSYRYQYLYYVKTDNISAISGLYYYSSNNPTTIFSNISKLLKSFVFKTTNNRYFFGTTSEDDSITSYDVYEDYLLYYLPVVSSYGSWLRSIKNYFSDTNKDYIFTFRFPNNEMIDSVVYVTNDSKKTICRKYRINGEMYICVRSNEYCTMYFKLE